MARTAKPPRTPTGHSVYVVELEPKVWSHARFRNANPDHDITKPCVYVGCTGLTPEERFANHRRGHKSSAYVTKYGLRLLPNLYRRLNPMPYELARTTEVMLALKLRRDGWGVWQA